MGYGGAIQWRFSRHRIDCRPAPPGTQPNQTVTSIGFLLRVFAFRHLPTAVGAVLCIAAMLLAGQSMAQPSATVSGVRLGQNGETTRFVIDVNRDVKAQVLMLADPYRLVIDLPEVTWTINGKGSGEGRGLVSRYRYGLFQPGRSRLVLDLKQPAAVERFFTLKPQGPYRYRLVFDLKATSRSAFLAAIRQPVAPRAAPPTQSEMRPTPSVRAADAQRVIVIDPGHGGVDPGTLGVLGVPEKTIVLSISKKVAAALRKNPRYKVHLTRSRDVFIPLRQRIAKARDVNADLFISIHADALRDRRVRGSTVYTLSERASDAEAAALAAKENKSDVIAGIDLGGESNEVTDILIDLAQRETMNYSARFANMLIPELGQRVLMRNNSHRFAGFVVLKAPDVPSVLVETGYLSNRQDAKVLASADGQRRIAAAVAEAVDTYFADLEAELY